VLGELLNELATVRQANIALFDHMDQAAWQRTGTVNQIPTSTRGLAYILVGHAQHHAGVLKERYAAVQPRRFPCDFSAPPQSNSPNCTRSSNASKYRSASPCVARDA